MAEVKKINVGPALTVPLALVQRGGQAATNGLEKFAVSEKFSKVKEHPTVAKITSKSDMLWTILGLVLIFHGAQFKNLFLCTQVVVAFCYDRVKGSIVSLHGDVTTAQRKMTEDISEESKADAKAEAKPDNKHAAKRASSAKDAGKPSAQQNEEDAAATKKLLKVLDSDKITAAVFEVFVAYMACHMVMQGGLAKVVLVTNALVKAFKPKLVAFLEFSGHEDMESWTDLLVTFVLYSFFGGMAVVMPALAFALTLAACGAQLVAENGLRVAESMGKNPEGLTVESTKGLMALSGLTVFGAIWQVWALMADNGMAWYFKMMYLPAYTAEGIVSLF